ncbi:MAG: hypothetical protein ACE5FZ_05930 [Nitrospiria bacterium]
MIHNDPKGQHFTNRDSIDIRACNCGMIHLSFFGRTTFHLSHQEFLEFSGGVAQAAASIQQGRKHAEVLTLQESGLIH